MTTAKDGGGHWNRAARLGGGPRKAVLIEGRSWEWSSWIKAVSSYLLGAGLTLPMVSTVAELEGWYQAGERASWAAATLIDRHKANSKPSDSSKGAK